MDGRVWWEALANPTGEPGDVGTDEISSEVHHPDGFDPRVMLHRVGETKYLDRVLNGWRINAGTYGI